MYSRAPSDPILQIAPNSRMLGDIMLQTGPCRSIAVAVLLKKSQVDVQLLASLMQYRQQYAQYGIAQFQGSTI
jgi:hypothetical protein